MSIESTSVIEKKMKWRGFQFEKKGRQKKKKDKKKKKTDAIAAPHFLPSRWKEKRGERREWRSSSVVACIGYVALESRTSEITHRRCSDA